MSGCSLISQYAQLSGIQFSIDHLNGSEGRNREIIACEITAKSDYEAVQCWLNEYKDSNQTFQSYRKEAERLLLWCIIQHKKPLSSLNREDFEAYFSFLMDPQPKELWCGQRGGKGILRGSPGWRPFVGGLSKSAQSTSITIINSLMSYLVDARYLKFNPLSLMRKKRKSCQNLNKDKTRVFERILEKDEWEAIIVTVNAMPTIKPHQQDEKERARFILSILFLLGLRINELVTHHWGAFKKIRGEWWFFVIGKGEKEGKIPVNDHLTEAVVRYRTHLKLSPYPSPEDMMPLIASWHTGEALSARHINQILKKIAITTARRFMDQPEKAEKLKRFSAHWIRHLSATHQDEAGVPMKFIKENHRHESDETTRKYVHTRERERHEMMQKLQLSFQ